jgi:FdhE protein
MNTTPAATPGLMNIGEEATPPFAVLPEPATLFLNRAKRLDTLAPGHVLEGYLKLVADICRAQAAIIPTLPPLAPPAQIYAGMPPVQCETLAGDDVAVETLGRLAEALDRIAAPAEFKAVLTSILSAPPATRRLLLEHAAHHEAPAPDDIASHAIASAALQVHATRLAALLDVTKLDPVADGVCPVCASPPVASTVVSWPSANNTRFCACSMCATQWHVVRLKCVSCGTTGGIKYPHIEGHSEDLRAETCDGCKRYVKIVYQTKNPALEPFADDVASLDLDLMLKNEGWTRGGRNPFLVGY